MRQAQHFSCRAISAYTASDRKLQYNSLCEKWSSEVTNHRILSRAELLTFNKMQRGFRFSIDRGGTFTARHDIYAECPNGKTTRMFKLLSEYPHNYPDAPREGIRRIMQEVNNISVRNNCGEELFGIK